VPDLTHLWQRFLLASALVVGLLIGIAVTVFGYGNRTAVSVHWSVFHVDGVPLWVVAVVPVAILLIAGTLYHWMDGLHHFTEHMRHRHRVHELEAEVTSLRAHLDHVLDMPSDSAARLPRKSIAIEPAPEHLPAEPARLPEPVAETPPATPRKLPRARRAALLMATEAAAPPTTNGGHETTATEPAP
jgi:uncharacterized integral membrane protein